MNGLFKSRPRPGRALAVATAVAGPVVAISLLASLDTDGGFEALLHIVAATLALAIGLAVVIRLQRAALVDRSRGRSVRHGAREPGATSAFGVAMATTVIVLVVSAVIEMVALQASARQGEDDTPGTQALQDARARRAAASGASLSGSRSGTRLVGPSPAGVGAGEGGGAGMGDLLSGAEVFRVRPIGAESRDLLAGAPLHLRGFVLDTYDAQGRLRERRGLRAMTNGVGRDWLDVQDESEPLSGSLRVELEIAFVRESNGLVFAPNRLTGVRASSLESDIAQKSYWLQHAAAHTYRVRSTLPAIGLHELRSTFAKGTRNGATDVPRAARYSERGLALDSIRSYAAALTDGLDTDVDRVLAIVRHLRKEFSYQIYDTRFLSPEEALPFVERAAGSCTHFASLAALLLRLEGIPTRLAAGYVAREVDSETGEWIVRERDGHAWIEVHFDGYGWLPFDPTPGDPSVGGTTTGWSPLLDEALTDAGTGHGAARTSPLGRVLVGAFDAIAGALVGTSGPAASVAVSLGGLLVLAALIVLVRRALARRGASDGGDRRSSGGTSSIARPKHPSTGVTDLLSAVRDRGWTQGRTTTPSSFSRTLEAQHPEARGLVHAFRIALRRACTGGEVASAEERHLHEVGDRIRAGRDTAGQ